MSLRLDAASNGLSAQVPLARTLHRFAVPKSDGSKDILAADWPLDSDLMKKKKRKFREIDLVL